MKYNYIPDEDIDIVTAQTPAVKAQIARHLKHQRMIAEHKARKEARKARRPARRRPLSDLR